MRGWRPAFLSAAGCLAATAFLVGGFACSAFSSASPGEPTPDEEEEDAGREGGSSEGDAASSDAGQAWAPCSTRPPDVAHFCDDFDLEGDIAFKWTRRTLVGGGGVDPSIEALSPPRAIVTSLEAGTTGTAIAALDRNRPPALDPSGKDRLVLSFALRIDAAPYAEGGGGNGWVHVAVLTLDDPACVTSGTSKQREIAVSMEPSDRLLVEVKGLGHPCDAGLPQDYLVLQARDALHALVDGKFHRVRLELTRKGTCPGLPAAVGSLRFFVDEKEGECAPLGVDAFAYVSTQLDLRLGLYSSERWGATRVSYDNVQLDLD